MSDTILRMSTIAELRRELDDLIAEMGALPRTLENVQAYERRFLDVHRRECAIHHRRTLAEMERRRAKSTDAVRLANINRLIDEIRSEIEQEGVDFENQYDPKWGWDEYRVSNYFPPRPFKRGESMFDRRAATP